MAVELLITYRPIDQAIRSLKFNWAIKLQSSSGLRTFIKTVNFYKDWGHIEFGTSGFSKDWGYIEFGLSDISQINILR